MKDLWFICCRVPIASLRTGWRWFLGYPHCLKICNTRYQSNAAQQIAAADAAASRLTGRSLSQAFGLANVLGYHRRAAELNRWQRRYTLRQEGRYPKDNDDIES
jgi:hypothetical protein